MGSSQSLPNNSIPTTTAQSKPEKSLANESIPPKTTISKPEKSQSNLKGVALVEHRCRKKKKAWKRCVAGWYSDRFLSGKALEEERSEDNCEDLFDKFRECYIRGMAKERKVTPKEGSILREYMEEDGIDIDKK